MFSSKDFDKRKQGGVSHIAKEELWKFKHFTMHKYNFLKIPLKEAQNILQDIIITL